MPDSQPQSGTVYNPFLYNASIEQLQKYLLLAVVVAGKVARIQQEKLDQFLAEQARCYQRDKPPGCPVYPTPFDLVRYCIQFHNNLRQELELVRMGQYTRVEKAYRALVCKKLDLKTCSWDDLCEIPGIGMKTASFFILFSRRDARLACLDTHILAYLREYGYPDAPRSTPPPKTYLKWEAIFLARCDELFRNPAEFDFEVWKARNYGDKQLIAKKKS